jgi:serine/threonine protein kinase
VAKPPVVARRRTMFSNVTIEPRKSTSGPQDLAPSVITPLKMRVFPVEKSDYQVSNDEQLGSGRWSTVYLATPLQAKLKQDHSIGLLTPPTTPTRSHYSGSWLEATPEYYAVKVASNRSSIKVLKDEATILSHLSSLSWCKDHIVPFHGYDIRNDSIVFSALPASLEDLIIKELSYYDESSHVAKLSSIFPRIIRSLTTSLAWIHAASVIHADIKPANILLRPDVPFAPGETILDIPFTPVFADFTSSFRTDIVIASTSSAMGGGTYDFLAPELLTKPYPPPAAASDVYALAITLLNLIIGTSPFSGARGNRYHLLEMAKSGKAIDFVLQDARSEIRLRETADAIHRSTGLDIIKPLNLGLKKSPDERITAREWCTMF